MMCGLSEAAVILCLPFLNRVSITPELVVKPCKLAVIPANHVVPLPVGRISKHHAHLILGNMVASVYQSSTTHVKYHNLCTIRHRESYSE